MLLNTRKVKDLLVRQQGKNHSINGLLFRYHNTKKVVLVDTKGIGNVVQEDSFFENLYEDILCIDSFCLTRLAKRFETNMELSTVVLPDGTIDFTNVQVSIMLTVPRSINLTMIQEQKRLQTFIYGYYRKMAPFHANIQDIRFCFQNHRLCTVKIEMNLNLDKIGTLFESTTVNQQILEQWLSTFEIVYDHSAGEHSIDYLLPMVKGKMRFDMHTVDSREKFTFV